MPKIKYAQVIKSNDVKVTGTQLLDTLGELAGMNTDEDQQPARAEIVGQEDGFVIIRVICSCGKDIQLRCATGNQEISG